MRQRGRGATAARERRARQVAALMAAVVARGAAVREAPDAGPDGADSGVTRHPREGGTP